MRFLFVYQNLSLGGVESVLRSRYLGLKRTHPNVEFECLFLHRRANPKQPIADTVHVTDDPARITAIARSADVVSVIDTPAVFAPVEASGRPLVIEVHSTYSEALECLSGRLPSNTRLLLFPSRAALDSIRPRLTRRAPQAELAFVHNPLAPLFFDDGAESPPRGIDFRGAQPILWVGRLDGHKNWRGAVEIARRLQRDAPRIPFELVLVGLHPEPDAAMETLRREGVLGRTRHLPFVDFASMPALYRAVARNGGVHLATSRNESFGMTVAEAMACGLPCVLPPLAAFREVGGAAALHFDSPKQAVRQLEDLLRDASLRNRLAGEGKAIAEHFRPEHHAAQLHALFARLA